jgi:ATP synthase protein I
VTRERDERFSATVGARVRRKARARAHRENIWFGLGMFGLVGWSVVVPTLIGIAVGVWLDSRSSGGGVSWTLTGLAVGLATGCLLAWYWVRQESRSAPNDEHRGAQPGGEDR